MRLDHLLSKEHSAAASSDVVGEPRGRRTIDRWLLIIVDAGCMQGFGLLGELVLFLRERGRVTQGFKVSCSVRCWVLREHVSVFLSEKRQGCSSSRTAWLGRVGVMRCGWCLVVL